MRRVRRRFRPAGMLGSNSRAEMRQPETASGYATACTCPEGSRHPEDARRATRPQARDGEAALGQTCAGGTPALPAAALMAAPRAEAAGSRDGMLGLRC